MNSIAEAFDQAGYVPPMTPAQRLRQMMRDAIEAGRGMADPSRDHFIAALHKANDTALLWELFSAVRWPVIDGFFTETLIAMRAEQDAAAESRNGVSKDHRLVDKAAAPVAAGGTRQKMLKDRVHDVPPPRPSRLRYEERDSVARLSILKTFRKVGNMPFGEVTISYAREWLGKYERDGRFVRLVLADLETYGPSHDEQRIGDLLSDERADELYRLAQEERANDHD